MDSADDYPTECDVLVIGTGMVESIVGAAASRIGRKTVVLDRNDFYGNDWAAFSREALMKWIYKQLSPQLGPFPTGGERSLGEGEIFMELPAHPPSEISHLEYTDHATDVVNKMQVPAEPIRDTETKPAEPTESRDQPQIEDGGDRDTSNAEDQTPPVTESETKAKEFLAYRRFNISLPSKLLYASDKFVNLLIESSTTRYCEFLAVSDIRFLQGDKFEKVPSCRADIFQNTSISLVEKRQMMRLLEFCLNETSPAPTSDQLDVPFHAYLVETHGLSERLAGIIVHCILHTSLHTSTQQCLDRFKLFCSSLGVYANSPFLWTLYGIGEVTQAFSRLNAIFGGTFILGEDIQGLVLENSKAASEDQQGSSTIDTTNDCDSCLQVKAVVMGDGRRVNCKHLVISSFYLPASIYPAFAGTEKVYLRGILVTDRSLISGEPHSVTLLTIPPTEGRLFPARVIQESPESYSPEEYYIVHVTAEDESPQESARCQLTRYIRSLFTPLEHQENTDNNDSLVPRVFLEVYFKQRHVDTSCKPSDARPVSNLFACPGPDADLSAQSCVEQSEEIFRRICPDEVFLPRVPDPSDIIIGGEEVETPQKPSTSEATASEDINDSRSESLETPFGTD